MGEVTRPARALAAIVLAGVGACGLFEPREHDPNVAYTTAQERALLEVPPNLAANDRQALLRIPADGRAKIARNVLLPEPDSVRLVRDGRRQWLEIDVDPRQLWPELRDFWTARGIAVVRDEPLIGVMETDWETRVEDVPSPGFFSSLLGNLTGSSERTTLHKYRVRLERAGENRVRLFLTERISREEILSDSDRNESLRVTRVAHPEETHEVLARLMVHLGVREQVARGLLSEREVGQLDARAYLDDSGGSLSVVVAQPFAPVWRQTAEALEDAGLEIEDTVAADTRYEVLFSGVLPEGVDIEREPEERGFIERFFGTDSIERTYQVYVLEEPGRTRITIADAAGDSRYPQLEKYLLEQVYEAFR